MESERDKMKECKKRKGRKLKADYFVSESLVSLRTGRRSRGRKPVFSRIVFIKAGPQGNEVQLKITSCSHKHWTQPEHCLMYSSWTHLVTRP